MKMEVHYDGRTYGTGDDATKYKLSIVRNQNSSEVNLSIKFEFFNPTAGQSDNWNSWASVIGGEICIPPQQAVALASEIIKFCRPAEEIQPSRIELIIDENTIENKATSIRVIRAHILANVLKVETKRIISEAQKLGVSITLPAQTLSVEIAKMIREKIAQESSR